MGLEIHERFKDARIVHNKNGKQTIREVESATGVNYGKIQRVEDGEGEVGHTCIAPLAKHYGVSTDYLLGLCEDPYPIPSATNELGLPPGAVHFFRDLAEKQQNGKIVDYGFINTLYNFMSLLDSTNGLRLIHAMKKYIDAEQAQKIIDEIVQMQPPLFELHNKVLQSAYSQDEILNGKPEKELYKSIEKRIAANVDPEGVRSVLAAYCQLADSDNKKELLAYLSGFKISNIVKNEVYESLLNVLKDMNTKPVAIAITANNADNTPATDADHQEV